MALDIGQTIPLHPSNLELDTSIKVLYQDDITGKLELREEVILAHRVIIAKSPYLRKLVEDTVASKSSTLSPAPISIEVDICGVKDALNAFKAFLNYLYGGHLDIAVADADSLLYLSKLCEVPALETEIRTQLLKLAELMPFRMPSMLPFAPSTFGLPLPISPDLNSAYLQLQALLAQHQQLQNTHHLAALMRPSVLETAATTFAPLPLISPMAPLPTVAASDTSATTESARNEPSPVGSDGPSSSVGSNTPFDSTELLPSNDKDGWCRNKKYIESTKKGYRCTVCNKVYGRYNSVSYHVTIYHRNPPIQCDEEGCNFTTREARYIHFHKYYKHHIPLPDTIDLASRKCPFVACNHVSKSPAMLEKHLVRHVAECMQDGNTYKCPECPFTTGCHRDVLPHVRTHHTRTLKTMTDGIVENSKNTELDQMVECAGKLAAVTASLSSQLLPAKPMDHSSASVSDFSIEALASAKPCVF